MVINDLQAVSPFLVPCMYTKHLYIQQLLHRDVKFSTEDFTPSCSITSMAKIFLTTNMLYEHIITNLSIVH